MTTPWRCAHCGATQLQSPTQPERCLHCAGPSAAKRLFYEVAEAYPPTLDGIRGLLRDPRWCRAYPTSELLPGGKLAREIVDIFSDTPTQPSFRCCE